MHRCPSTIETGPVGAVAERYLEAGRFYRDQPEASVHLHHVTIGMELPPEASIEMGVKAIKALVAGVPATRARFEKTAEGWRHVIPDRSAIDLEITEIAAEGAEWDAAVSRFLVDFNHLPFHLEDEPLFKSRFITNGKRTAHIFKIHHILCDAYSGFLICELLRNFIRKFAGDQDFEYHQPARDFLALFERERAHSASAEARANIDWFANQIGDHSLARGPLTGRRDGWLQTLTLPFSPEQAQALLDAAKAAGSTLPILLFTVFAQALQHVRNDDDLLICFQKLNRNAQTMQAVADLSDLLLVRYREGRHRNLGDSCAASAETIRDAKAHWEPYWRIVQNVNPDKYFAPMGLSPFLYNYLNATAAPIVEGPYGLKPLPDAVLETRCTLFDFLCNVICVRLSDNEPPILTVNLRYNDAVIDSSAAIAIRDFMRDRVDALINNEVQLAGVG